jgi:catechol 2,3-dioxygenase-like lactoylglutathione lyase family enzyme
MSLDKIIRQIPDWQNKSAAVVLADLQAETIPFENGDSFTWKGLASVYVPEAGRRFGAEGNRALQNVLEQQGDKWLISQLATGVPLLDDEVQQTFYLLDQAGFVPGARHLAREVKRNISLLEHARIQERIEKFHIEIEVPSIEEIEACVFAMKLADLRVLREEQMWDRVQAYRIALTAYDGIGREPEL